jgi:hypothetical protein
MGNLTRSVSVPQDLSEDFPVRKPRKRRSRRDRLPPSQRKYPFRSLGDMIRQGYSFDVESLCDNVIPY